MAGTRNRKKEGFCGWNVGVRPDKKIGSEVGRCQIAWDFAMVKEFGFLIQIVMRDLRDLGLDRYSAIGA